MLFNDVISIVHSSFIFSSRRKCVKSGSNYGRAVRAEGAGPTKLCRLAGVRSLFPTLFYARARFKMKS